MSLDQATADRYSHYSFFPRPPDFQLEPSTDIIHLDPPKYFNLKTNSEYLEFNAYTGRRQSSIDTMTSTQSSDDMEAFQRLSDQYEPEVAVGDLSIVRGPQPILIILGTIGWAEAICSSIDHGVCQCGSRLPNKDRRKCCRISKATICADRGCERLCRQHTPDIGPSKEMANVAGEVRAFPRVVSP